MKVKADQSDTLRKWYRLVEIMVATAWGIRLPLGNLETTTDAIRMRHSDVGERIVAEFDVLMRMLSRVDSEEVRTSGSPLNVLYPHIAEMYSMIRWSGLEFPTVGGLLDWMLEDQVLIGVLVVDLGTAIQNYERRDELFPHEWVGSLFIETTLGAQFLGCLGHVFERCWKFKLGATHRYIDIRDLRKDWLLHALDDIVLYRAVGLEEQDWVMWRLFRNSASMIEGEGGIGWISDSREADFRERFARYKQLTTAST